MELTEKERNLLKYLIEHKREGFMWQAQLLTKMNYTEVVRTAKTLSSKGFRIRMSSMQKHFIERLQLDIPINPEEKKKLLELVE